jgi:Family of unknown function (DUF6069)
MTNRTRRRLGTVVLAPVAALAAWGVARLLGVELEVSSGDGTVGAGDVVSAAVAGALAGWVVAWVLERHSRSPRAWWAFAGSTALAVSMIGPSWLADGGTAVALMALHLVVAVVVIGGFVSTLPPRRLDARATPLPGGDPAR